MNEFNSEYLEKEDLAIELAKVFAGDDLRILKMRYGLGEYNKFFGLDEIASVVGFNVDVVRGRILSLLKSIQIQQVRDALVERIALFSRMA
jgi:hypothetical protein